MTDAELIIRSVEASGLSSRRFAERVMSRDERTIRRWSAGQVAIPATARTWLCWWLTLSDTQRARFVRMLD